VSAGTLVAVDPATTVEQPPIRTFKTRKGRITSTQADALARWWPVVGVPVDGRPLDLAALFGRVAPVVVEVGCGMGDATAALAAAEPERDVLAVDVHTPGVGNLLALVERLGLTNVRVAEGDAVVVLRDMLAPSSLDEVRVLFPDPWPKARHHKRRLVQPAFAELVSSRLRPGGRWHVATDWPPYAEQVLDVVAGCDVLDGGVTTRPPGRPVTRFERRALAAGRPVVDVVAVRRH
jgi:tRNA (guanine-N7-)-methyltransferase